MLRWGRLAAKQVRPDKEAHNECVASALAAFDMSELACSCDNTTTCHIGASKDAPVRAFRLRLNICRCIQAPLAASPSGMEPVSLFLLAKSSSRGRSAKDSGIDPAWHKYAMSLKLYKLEPDRPSAKTGLQCHHCN